MEKNVEEKNVVSVTDNTAVAQKSLPLKMLWLGFAFLWLSAMLMILFFKLGQVNDLSIWLALKVDLANMMGKAGVFSLAMLLPVICYRGIARLLAKGTVLRYEWIMVGIGSLLIVGALGNTMIQKPYSFIGIETRESNVFVAKKDGDAIPVQAEELNSYKLAAAQGDAQAQYQIGRMYDFGRGVEKNYAEALKWYKLAAAQGLADAQNYLGDMYGLGLGVVIDYAEAVKWYKLATAQGLAQAQYNLGDLYFSGHGVVQDYAEAVKWYKLAAAQGLAQAQNNLGSMYHHGQGVVQDYVRAHMWSNLAATKGDADAVKNRQYAAVRMTTQQIAAAQKLASECQARDYKNCD